MDKVVGAVNKGQECIKRPNPFACNGYPGFVIAKVHSFKVKRLVPRLSLVSLSTRTFKCICDCCSFLDATATFLRLYLPQLPPPPSCLNHESSTERYRVLILNRPELKGLIQCLRRVKHLIILALRLIGIRLNLFQVPDIISLIPGITRHLKQLSSGKADHTDYSPITFLSPALCPFPFISLCFTHTHIILIWTDALCMVRGRFAVSYRVRTKPLWSMSIFGLLMDLFPFSYGAGLVE